MAKVTISSELVRDPTGRQDNRPWYVFGEGYQPATDGLVTPRRSRPIYPVAGTLSFEVEAGKHVWIENPSGDQYYVTIGDEDQDLEDLLATAVGVPPDSSQDLLDAAVETFVENNPGYPWSGVADKPAVIAAGDTAEDARDAIEAQGRIVFDPHDFDPDFTANPLNTFDCTPAIQAALDACRDMPGGEVVLPVGYLKVTGLTIYNNTILRGQGDYTILQLTGGSNKNLIQSASFGHATNDDRGIVIRDMRLIANRANQTVVVGQAQLTAMFVVGTDTTMNVTDTTGFGSSGIVWCGWASVAYTGKTSTTFTGCSPTNETGDVAQGAWVNPVAGQGHAVALQAHRCRLENLTIEGARGSGIYIQGPYDGQYQAENILADIKAEYCSRFGVEIGENASDGMASKIIPGGNLMGGLHFRGGNWTVMDTHPVGNFATYDQLGPALHIASNETRIINCLTDTWPSTPVMIDGFVRGIGPANTQISNLRTFQANHGGGSMVTIKAPSAETVARTHVSDANLVGPCDWAFSSGPTTVLVGAQNLASPAGGKVQVRCAGDFGVTSAAEGSLNISGDTLAYAGRQMSGTFCRTAAAIGDTTITVDSTTGFDSSGTIQLTGLDSNGVTYRVQTLTYTGKTSTTFTGIPSSGAGSVLYATTGWPTSVTQHFFTGVAGGSVSASDGATVEVTAAQPLIAELSVVAPMFRSYQKGIHRILGSSDIQIVGGYQSGRPMSGSVAYTATSADTTLDPAAYCYVLTGGTARTFTLPSPSNGKSTEFVFKNRASADLTIASAHGAVIYDDALVSSLVIPPGGSARVISDSTYWEVVGSRAAWRKSTLAGTATLGATDGLRYIVLLASGAAPTLPTAVGNNALYTLVNAHTAAIAVLTTSSQTIDGQTTFTAPAGASIDLISDGSNWRVI